jgi:hypothetical protein
MIYFCVKFQKDPQFKIGIGWTNFAAVAMETKKGGFNFFFISLIKLHEAL